MHTNAAHAPPEFYICGQSISHSFIILSNKPSLICYPILSHLKTQANCGVKVVMLGFKARDIPGFFWQFFMFIIQNWHDQPICYLHMEANKEPFRRHTKSCQSLTR